jgi:uracil permease
MKERIMPEDRVKPLWKELGFSIQMMFSCFSATILVPLIVGLSPSIALFSAGIGTIIYLLCTGFKVPMFLGSSFAFIPALLSTSQQFGWGATSVGVIASGLFYTLIAFIIGKKGTNWLDKVFPPIVIGSVIITIGMSLLPATISATFGQGENYNIWKVIIGLITFGVIAFISTKLKGYIKAISILIGIIFGYILTIVLSIIVKTDFIGFSSIKEAPWFVVPINKEGFLHYTFEPSVVITFLIVSLATIIEHIGDNYTISSIVGREFYKVPGLHKTILGDGLASAFAGLVGSVPNTSYAESVATQNISSVHSVRVIFGAALLAVILSFFGKFSALIATIPWSVLNGACLALYGMISASGLKKIVEAKIDFNHIRNLLICSSILTIGIGGVSIQIGKFSLTGVALATLIGIVLNLTLPKEEK